MYDKQLVLEILRNISASLLHIRKRFSPITSPNDFIKDDIGLEKLDSICMQVTAIGEAFKQIDKITNGKLFAKYPKVDWKKAMGMRDIIVHHYFDIDHEVVYHVCKDRMPEIEKTILLMIQDLEAQ